MIRIYNSFLTKNEYAKKITAESIDNAILKFKKDIEVEKEVLLILEGLSEAIKRLNLKDSRMMTAKVVEQIQEQMSDDLVLTYKNKVENGFECRVITFDLKDSNMLEGYTFNKIGLLKKEGTIAGFLNEIGINIGETLGYISHIENKIEKLENVNVKNMNDRIAAVELQLRKLESEIEEIEDITKLL